MASWKEKLKFTAVAGAGFFTDGYINLTIGLGKMATAPSNALTNTPYSCAGSRLPLL